MKAKNCWYCGQTYMPFHPQSKFCSFGCGVMYQTGEVRAPEDTSFVPNETFEKSDTPTLSLLPEEGNKETL